MMLTEAGYVYMGFMLFMSGIQGRQLRICALKGLSVNLPCSAKHPTLGMKWYTGHWIDDKYVLNEVSADGDRVTYNKSQTSNFTLRINNLTESDANDYCCKETTGKPENSKQIQLHVADLQVQVIPTTEGQTVTLMCSTSCALTETTAVYIWYKNRESLYQDWSPWYQELVSSEEAVRYSCAIEGYEDLRAPEVSVDSVTSTCFSVTYAKGRMCSYHQTSEDEPCSITYPREIHVHKSPAAELGRVRLTCNTRCPPTAVVSYKSRFLLGQDKKTYLVVPSTSTESFSCAVEGLEDLRSAEVCTGGSNCWSVNYASRRICALRGSSVDILSEYSYFNYQPRAKLWHKMKRYSEEEDAGELVKSKGRVEYHENMRNRHILRITNLKKDDSAKYRFKLQKDPEKWEPGVTLVVTGLKVKFAPSAVVTEDQRVTLTCSTSCPLTNNTNYIWFFNSRPLTLTEHQNKHLVLDPVSSQHAGNYSCAAKTQTDIRSPAETLSVHRKEGRMTLLAATGVCAPLLVIIPLIVFLWIRKKRSSHQSPRNETPNHREQLNPGPIYENILAQSTEQEDHLYWGLHFPDDNMDALYTTFKPGP